MNVNVVVFNVSQDFRVGDVRDLRRDRDGQFSRRSDNLLRPDPNGPEQVIELVPHDGAWMGKSSTGSPWEVPRRRASDVKALGHSAAVTTYDHDGRVCVAPQDKGLRINITA